MKNINNKTNLYRNLALGFFLISLLIILGISYLLFSWTNIMITPKANNFTAEYIVDLHDSLDQNSSNDVKSKDNYLNGKIIEKTKQIDGSFSTLETKKIDQKSTGKVMLINKLPTSQPLVANTRLLTSGDVLFRLKNSVVIPGNSELETEVVADKPGKNGEVGPSSFIIPGLNISVQDKVYAKSFESMKGGQVAVKVLSQNDIDNATDAMMEKVINDFQKEIDLDSSLSEFKKSNYKLIFDKKVIDTKLSPKLGDTTDKFQISQKIKVYAFFINQNSLIDIVNNKLNQRLAENQELIKPTEKDMVYKLEKYDPVSKVANLKVIIKGQHMIKKDARLFDKNNLTNLSKEQIENYFKQFDEIEGIEVRFYPFWVIKSPTLVDHINVIIKK